MKYSKLVLGILAIMIAIWVIVGEQMAGASADAVINAPIVTVRAPVAGNLALGQHSLGSRVTTGETIASIEDPLVDRVRLNDLLMDVRLSEASVDQLKNQLEQVRLQSQVLAQRASVYRETRIAEIRARLSHARARLALLEDEPGSAGDTALLDAVGTDGQRLPGAPQTYLLALEHAREHVAVLEVTLDAAERGVFLGDGYNDAPNSEQRAIELDEQISSLSGLVTEAEARLAASVERTDRERIRVNGNIGGEIQSPVTGIFWETLEADGVTIQRGDPLLRLVDCSETMVTLSVTERTYNTLSIGQAARFRLAGTSDVMEATVGRLAGSGAATVYRHLAIAPSPRHLERFDVTLNVPALRNGGTENCKIGQTGRAFFETRPLDGLRSLFE